jgi:hypothetical protein
LGEHAALTEVTVVDGAETAILAVPTADAFWLEIAVMVTTPEAGPVVGAVNNPEEEMLPALADQDTAELKLPVPATDARQAEVAPVETLVGEQTTPTEVTVEDVVGVLMVNV